MKRRSFLLTLSSAVGMARFAPLASAQSMKGMDMKGMDMGGKSKLQRLSKLPVGQPLPDLVKLPNTSITSGLFEAVLEAAPAKHEFVAGLHTELLAYNGAVPGAMIEVTEGDTFKVTFRNRIPGQDSTIHWHGLDVPPEQDGNPTHPVASSAERDYEFTIPEGSAGSYWYHPHPHGHTAEQVYRGLAGPFVVKAKVDPLPAQLGDTTLFISTISLNSDGTIAENTMADTMNGREGDHVLVNGAKQPVLTLAPGTSRRFRLYNATNGRFLKLSFENHVMTLVGTDGGLIAAPVAGLKELLLTPGERAEVVVDFQKKEGAVKFVSLSHERGWMGQNKPSDATLTVMSIKLAGPTMAPTPLPTKLRDIADLGAPAAIKQLELSETMGMANGMMNMGFLIDGKSFDMNRVDQHSKLGDVELWEIKNTSGMDHPFHIHGGQFQIVERELGGTKTPPSFIGWKDSVNIANKEIVRVKMRQSFAGLRMYHCHILEHED
ncbi:MAG: multicopper oxidase family protein, partial [Aestuariivirga sp.]